MDRMLEQHVAVDAFHVDASGGARVSERLGVQGAAAGTRGPWRRLGAGLRRFGGSLGAFGVGQDALLAVGIPSSHSRRTRPYEPSPFSRVQGERSQSSTVSPPGNRVGSGISNRRDRTCTYGS
jgi:hypothetical protein